MYKAQYKPIYPLWAFALILLGILGVASAQAGMTPAGTKITNLATVTYEDSLGNEYTAQSNESLVKVAAVYAPKLEKPQTLEGTPGQTVYFPHQIHNEGNTGEVFRFAWGPSQQGTLTQDDLKLYHDTNGNGQPDAGEPAIASDGTLLVDAGSVANLIMAVEVPTNATSADTYSVELIAISDKRDDNTNWRASNEDTIQVTDGPALVVRKQEISHKEAALDQPGEVKYRIEITNNGSNLDKGAVYDFLPELMDLDSITDPSTQDTRLSAFDTTSHKKDELPPGVQVPAGAHETALYMEINHLVQGGTLAFEFTAQYSALKDDGSFNFLAADALKNKAIVGFVETGGQSPVWEKFVESNTTTTPLPQFFGVEALGTENDSSTVTKDTASAGGIADFKVTISNRGNGADDYALSINAGHNYPDGTIFTFWDETGTLQLAGNKTGNMVKGASMNIMVKAHLPAGTSQNGPFEADLKAVSTGDKSIPPQQATVQLVLSEITGAGVDASYTLKTENPSQDKDAYKKVTPPVKDIMPGESAEYTFFVRNESGASRSFTLNGYGNIRGVIGNDNRGNYKGEAFNNGMYVTFKDETGKTITTTPAIPHLGSVEVTAVLHVPEDFVVIKGSTQFGIIANDGDNTNDALEFAYRVHNIGAVELTPNGANQIEAGGSTLYTHKLRNTSNKTRTFKVVGTHSQGDGWAHIFQAQGPIQHGIEIHSEYVLVKLSPKGQPSDSLDFTVKVLSPANAAPGSIDVLTLAVKEVESMANHDKEVAGGLTTEATDASTVVKGQVRLYKKVKVLRGETGDGVVDEGQIINQAKNLSSSVFQVSSMNEQPIPGQDYVVWQVIAVNEGDSDAKNTIVHDAAPAFTTMVSNSAFVAEGDGAPLINGSNVSFFVGEESSVEQGGILKPGQSVEVRFVVKLD